MKLVSYEENDTFPLGLLVGERILPLSSNYAAYFSDGAEALLSTMAAFLAGGRESAEAASRVLALAEKDPGQLAWTGRPLAAPVPHPPKLLCLAGNYAAHVREGGQEAPEKETSTPRVFMKPSTTVVGPGAPILLPRHVRWLDWEAELAIVIGKRSKYLSPEEAREAIAGYTILNDISERQFDPGKDRRPRDGDKWFDWLNGKWLDHSAPMGPCLATLDEFPDPDDLGMALRVNGQTKQDARTSQMIFSCAEVVSWISRSLTLEPGDVIATGTPEGVGRARGEHLQAGDRVEVEIEGIGILANPVENEEAATP